MSDLLTTELVCSNCHEVFAAYRPVRDEEPLCPNCLVTTFEGVKTLFGYELFGKEEKKERAQ